MIVFYVPILASTTPFGKTTVGIVESTSAPLDSSTTPPSKLLMPIREFWLLTKIII